MTSYIVRKNNFIQDEDEITLGNPTQILGAHKSYIVAKEILYKELKLVLNEMILTGAFNEVYDSPNHYYLRMFMKHGENSVQSNSGYIYDKLHGGYSEDSNGYHNELKTEEDVEIFNLLYPTNAVELVLSKNDYLVNPVFNETFFDLSNQNYVKTAFQDELQESNNFLDMGLYVDELDFFNSIHRSVSYGQLTSYFSRINIEDERFLDKNELQNYIDKYRITVIENENEKNIHFNNFHIYSLNDFNSILKIKPFHFKKVLFKDIPDFQKNKYRDIIRDAKKYLNPYGYGSIDENARSIAFSLSLTMDFVLSILKDEE